MIVAGASGQRAPVVYKSAIVSGMTIAGFATVADDVPAPVLDCRSIGNSCSVAASEPRYFEHQDS